MSAAEEEFRAPSAAIQQPRLQGCDAAAACEHKERFSGRMYRMHGSAFNTPDVPRHFARGDERFKSHPGSLQINAIAWLSVNSCRWREKKKKNLKILKEIKEMKDIQVYSRFDRKPQRTGGIIE